MTHIYEFSNFTRLFQPQAAPGGPKPRHHTGCPQALPPSWVAQLLMWHLALRKRWSQLKGRTIRTLRLLKPWHLNFDVFVSFTCGRRISNALWAPVDIDTSFKLASLATNRQQETGLALTQPASLSPDGSKSPGITRNNLRNPATSCDGKPNLYAFQSCMGFDTKLCKACICFGTTVWSRKFVTASVTIISHLQERRCQQKNA